MNNNNLLLIGLSVITLIVLYLVYVNIQNTRKMNMLEHKYSNLHSIVNNNMSEFKHTLSGLLPPPSYNKITHTQSHENHPKHEDNDEPNYQSSLDSQYNNFIPSEPSRLDDFTEESSDISLDEDDHKKMEELATEDIYQEFDDSSSIDNPSQSYQDFQEFTEHQNDEKEVDEKEVDEKEEETYGEDEKEDEKEDETNGEDEKEDEKEDEREDDETNGEDEKEEEKMEFTTDSLNKLKYCDILQIAKKMDIRPTGAKDKLIKKIMAVQKHELNEQLTTEKML
jgi:hypothetical protein